MSAPQGGPWTRHGHDIPGTTVAGGRPPAVARCGGPALCRQCREDVAVAQGEKSAAPDRPTPGDDGTFGLRTALGEDGTAELLRRQRRTALAYGEHAAAERATAWLAANGYEEASDG